MAAKTNVLAFYVIGIPLGALLSFHFGIGIEGLWIGFGIGIATAFTICSTNLYYSSWEQIARVLRVVSLSRTLPSARLRLKIQAAALLSAAKTTQVLLKNHKVIEIIGQHHW
jgi:hypothetical protein